MLTQLALAIAGVVIVHVLAMAMCARAFGITIRTVSFGVGPAVLSLGRFRLSLLPVGGYVRLATSADAPEGEWPTGTLDHAARWKRVLLALAGPLVLVAVGALLLGAPAIDRFTQAFPQLLGCALSPLSKAQVLLHDATDALVRLPPAQVFGITACKFAAFNLLPTLGSNGLAAATGWLPQATLDGTAMARFQARVILPLTLLMLASWSLAMIVFVSSP